MKNFVTLLILGVVANLFSACAHRSPKLAVEYEHYYGNSRFLELPKSKVDKQFALVADIPVLFFQWRNKVWALGEPSRVSWVGWNFEVAAPFKKIEVYYRHHSQHRLDSLPDIGFFPVQDSVGFRWRIIE